MNIKKSVALTLMGVTMAIAGASYFFPAAQEGAAGKRGLETLIIASVHSSRMHEFEVEIASTPQEKEMGLMFRETMPPDHGMLFQLGEERVIRFWMKDTLIPLDMIFIAADGTVRKVYERATPKSLEGISSDVPVKAVLEINGGRANELGIVVGDKVVHPYFGLSKP